MNTRSVVIFFGIVGVWSYAFPGPLIGKERGLYGKIELGFMKETWDYENSYRFKLDRTLFIQDFQLGFSGYTYSPKLLSFDIGGNFRIDTSKYRSMGTETSSTLRGIGYHLNLNLLRGTFIPIQLYARRTYTPTRVIAGTFQQDIDTRTDSWGGSITFRRRNFFLTLSRNEIDVRSVIQGIDYRNITKENFATLSYIGKSGRFSTTYADVDTKTYSPFYSYFDRSTRFSANFNIGTKTWKFSALGSYYRTTLGRFELYTESANFSYTPNPKLSVNVLAHFSQYRGTVDTNYYTLSQMLNYTITENWSVGQTLNVFSLERSRAVSFGGSVSYTRNLPMALTVGFTTSGSVSKWFDGGEKNYYSYSVSGKIRKEFPSIRSYLSLNGSHSQLFKDGQRATTSNSVFETFGIRLGRRVNFSHSASYMKNTSREYDYEYEMVRTNNSLSWDLRILRKMNLNFRTGLDYWKVLNIGTESVKPYVQFSGSYPVTRRLFVSFALNTYRDTLYDNEFTASGNLKIKYTFRKVMLTFESGFNREVFSDAISYKRSRYFVGLKLIRTL